MKRDSSGANGVFGSMWAIFKTILFVNEMSDLYADKVRAVNFPAAIVPWSRAVMS